MTTTAHNLTCPDCGAPMVLKQVDAVGPLPFYACVMYPKCRATHGAFDNGAPMGVPGDKRTRVARGQAHEAFDRLWKPGGLMTRAQAYQWLRHRLNMTTEECHIGKFDYEQCQQVVRACAAFSADQAVPGFIAKEAREREIEEAERWRKKKAKRMKDRRKQQPYHRADRVDLRMAKEEKCKRTRVDSSRFSQS